MRSILLALVFLLAGCAEGDPPYDPIDEETTTTTPGGPTTIDLEVRTSGTYPVDPGFTPDRLEVDAGSPINLTFYNDDDNALVVHDWVLEGVEGAATQQIGSGESTTITFAAPSEPGEYTYYCSVGDHREQGMEGTLVVA